MLDRVAMGALPRKHHTALRGAEGQLLYEHCLTRQGFEGPYTILYQRSLPPRDVGRRLSSLPADPPLVPPGSPELPGASIGEPLHRRHLRAGLVPEGGDLLDSRRVILHNRDLAVCVCRPDRAAPRYLQNGDGDELYFVHEGRGRLESQLGPLDYGPGDYLLVPRGVPYRLAPEGPSLLLLLEGRSYIEVPKSFRNAAGQLRMDAPYCHRDFRRPTELPAPAAPMESGGYQLIVKRGGVFHEILRDRDPFDVVGWDGSVYPLALSINDYQAKVGRVHLPPTIFATFAGGGFLVCSFVPRPVDYDPDAIPCPYPHSSVHCDEVIFYVSGNFTSRRGVGPGSISHHPMGLPHGPQPGAYEASIGKTRTDELAVMIDTFQPLWPAPEAAAIEDPAYHDSWAAGPS